MTDLTPWNNPAHMFAEQHQIVPGVGARFRVGNTMSRKHGLTKTPAHNSWRCMMQRCCNPKAHAYNNYGGRGITVCERWRTFENFYADMGDRPEGRELDRIDNDGNYEPGNCRWATRLENSYNRRVTRFIEAHGKRLTVRQWAEETGLSRSTITHRLCAGLDGEEAVKPTRRTHCHRGHSLADAYVAPNGYRACRVCGRENSLRRYHLRKGMA